jgi:hypothetical protein
MADRKLMAVLESGSEWMSALNDQVKELRSRLHALEQNTVPRQWSCGGCGAVGAGERICLCTQERQRAQPQNTVPSGSAKQKPREWWVSRDPDAGLTIHGPLRHAAFPDSLMHEYPQSVRAHYIRVREVIDE